MSNPGDAWFQASYEEFLMVEALRQKLAACEKERDELKRLPSPDITWLFTHCRAIGMTEKSLSGKWEDDIALFTTRLKEQLAVSQAREQKMRETLMLIENAYGAHITDTASAMKLIAKNALALPHDTSALDALTKDAERYRWLRDQTATDDIGIAMKTSCINGMLSNAENIDNYIDAAMKLGAGGMAPDLNTCPQCGGEADQGHDRECPPNPYLCSKCQKGD